VRTKLRDRHKVTEREVSQCFINRTGGLLEDTREKHKTNPPTEWFIAETNHGRALKICFVQVGTAIHIKSAYPPNAEEVRIYNAHAYLP
jgi:uncharacterized DUF497 family protein